MEDGTPEDGTPWDAILGQLRQRVDEEDFRRWFGATAYASDSGDQITVWVPTEAIRRLIESRFSHELAEALAALGRGNAHLRFVVAGMEEDEDDA
jgi:chromosomal replication initiation ATPase DnaA